MSSLLLPTNPEGVPGTVLEALVAARNIAGRSGVAAGGHPMDGEGEGGEEKDKKLADLEMRHAEANKAFAAAADILPAKDRKVLLGAMIGKKAPASGGV